MLIMRGEISLKNMKRLTACGAAAAVMLTAAPVCEAEEETVDRNNIIIDGTTANLKENMRYRGAATTPPVSCWTTRQKIPKHIGR